MAKSQESTTVIININPAVPFNSEMVNQIQQTISSKFDVNAVILPNPTIGKVIEVTSDTANQETINRIEGESTVLLFELLEATK